MGGTIAVAAQDLARFHTFTISTRLLKAPPDTTWDWRIGFNTARNRNLSVMNMAGDWVFFLDDDQAFEPDTLLKLLEREVDIVQALTPQRVPPFAPHAYKWINEDYKRADVHEVPETGISEWDGVACGCLLVRKQVFEKVAYPWFAVLPEGRSDDLYFCKKARDAGFKCYIDSDTRSGHMTITQVKPTYQGGRWGGELCFGNDLLR